MPVLDEKNILLGLDANDQEDCIRKIVALMAQNGYVEEDYADFVIEREKIYPTGLPTDGVIVAIPHANKGTVYHTGIGMAVLNKAVGFYNMAEKDQLLQTEMVFVMANTEAHQQLADLRKLMACFSQADLLLALKGAKSPQAVLDVFHEIDEDTL